MTGIAHGLSEIINIALGNTPILKVSKGDVEVWPPPVLNNAAYFVQQGIGQGFVALRYIVTVPVGATRMGVCMIAAGAEGNTSGQGAGGGGGGLAWFNMDVVAGQSFFVQEYSGARNLTFHRGSDGQQVSAANPGSPGGSNTGGNGGTAAVNTGQMSGLNPTFGISTGGRGGDTNTSGRSGGGGSSGGYGHQTPGVKGGDGFAATPGLTGTNGSAGSGGGATSTNPGGNAGFTGVFGQGADGAAGAFQGDGGGGSISLLTPAFRGGRGLGGRVTPQIVSGAFAIRFFAADYPLFVEADSITEPVGVP